MKRFEAGPEAVDRWGPSSCVREDKSDVGAESRRDQESFLCWKEIRFGFSYRFTGCTLSFNVILSRYLFIYEGNVNAI
jgi:hypothetical protein